MKKIGFIGFGNMAKALATGFLLSGKIQSENIMAYAPNQEKLIGNCSELGIKHSAELEGMVKECDSIFIACKPYQVEDIIGALRKKLADKSIVSVAAGWSYEKYRRILPENTRIQCIMPNTPVAVAKGVLLTELENNWDINEKKELIDLLSSVGEVVEIPGRLMNAATAVTGCGPAFMYMVIEAIGDAAVKNGIPRQQAYELASLTMLGSAQLQLFSGMHPGQLKDRVCSPAGTTIKGVAALEEANLRWAFIKAIDEASK